MGDKKRGKRLLGKKGISDILITVIMIGLVLVAIGVVWAVINNLVGSKTDEVSINSDCLAIDLRPTIANCSVGGACDVYIKRNAGGDEFSGIKMVFYHLNGTSSTKEATGNIEPLATVKKQATGLANVTRVEISAYFTNEVGEQQVCSQSSALVVND
jgi:hypothetical protein